MNPSHGWLERNQDLHVNWPHDAKFSKDLPTRPEEYDFVLKALKHDGPLLDAAAGYVPGWHIFANIVTDTHPDRIVLALDANPESLYSMPQHPRIIRMLGNLSGLPFASESFDEVVCISVLEHLPNPYKSQAILELARVTRHRLIITADEQDPINLADALKRYGFNCGPFIEPQNQLNPRVSYVIADLTRGLI